AEALEFAGYDVKFVLGDDGHRSKHGGAILPDALRWLWRDYPKPIVVREPAITTQPGWDPRGKVVAIGSASNPWQQVGDACKSSSGLSSDKDGVIYFSDPSANRIYQSGADGKISVFKENTGGAAAIRCGPDGRLYATQPARKRVVAY